MKGALTSSTDLNNIITSGMYYFPTGDVPANSPYQNASTILVFRPSSSTTTRIVQMAIRYGAAGQMSFRTYNSGTWLDWYNVTTYSSGDNLTINNLNTTGFITNSAQDIRFSIPLDKPVASGVSVSGTIGIIGRQNGLYTHGSASGTAATPSSVSFSVYNHIIMVSASMAETTNATNNDSIGLLVNASLSFD